MAVKKKVKTKVKRGAKKSFYEVEAPMTAVKISLYGNSPEELDGRIVKLDLTKSLRGKSLDLKMRIKNKDGRLIAEPVSAKLAGSFIRRSMRRGTDYVEDSFEMNCKDAKVSVKPFMITRRRVSRAVRKALRVESRKFLEGYIKIRDTKELFGEILSNKIQRAMVVKLKKIYPLGFCEIRIFEVKGEKSEEEIEEANEVEEANEKKVEVKEEKKDDKKVSKGGIAPPGFEPGSPGPKPDILDH
jgi:ribosomal protein S3AE